MVRISSILSSRAGLRTHEVRGHELLLGTGLTNFFSSSTFANEVLFDFGLLIALHNGPKARPVRTTHRVTISGVIYTIQARYRPSSVQV